LAAFPLILTFSRREKEQPLVGFLKSASSQAEFCFRFAKTLETFLPLPAGEGRGEGEYSSASHGHSITGNAPAITRLIYMNSLSRYAWRL
jgi:hypothetical protein